MSASTIPLSPLMAPRERIWPLVIVSLVAHAAVIAAAVVHRPAPPIDLQQKPIVARLVRLGEKRPEQWLPRKEAAPPPAAATPEPVPIQAAQPSKPQAAAAPVAKAPPAPPKPAAATRGPAKSGRPDVLASVMSRMEKEKAREPVYGDPSGVAGGDAEQAGAGDQYLALVERALRESYTLPSTLSERDRLYLKATVVLYVDADGTVLRYAFETRSGNPSFDSALERAIRAARLPPPPPELRKQYRTEGLGVMYRP